MVAARKRPVRAVAVYARQSKERESISVSMQLDRCRERAIAEGWAIAEEYEDRGKSGYAEGVLRPGYEQMLADLRAGKADGVLIYKADRLGRDDRERRRIEDLFGEAGLWMVADAFGGRYDLTTADGIKGFRDAINAAEHYSRQLSERMRDHHQVLADAGRDSGGMRPFGFEPDRVTVRELEAKMIRDAARRVIAGESLRSICARWNAEGRRTAGGAPWRPTRIRRILTVPRYTGLREHDGTTTEAVWSAIIDRATFDAVGAILEDPDRKTAESTARRRLLTGFLYCGNCEGKLYSHGTPKGRRYRCQNCSLVSIAADKLDEYVSGEAYNRYGDKNVTERTAGSEPEPEPVDEVAERLASIEERLRDLGREYAAGRIEMESFVEASKALRADRAELRRTVVKIPKRPSKAWSDLYAEVIVPPWEPGFDTADLESWREMISDVFSRVEVMPATKRGGRFDRSRVRFIER